MTTQLQVWYGILLSAPGAATPERPALPAWARAIAGSDDQKLRTALEQYGYNGDPLTWIEYKPDHQWYVGLAVAASVQSCEGSGEVNTTYPDEVSDRWLTSMARACSALGFSTAVISWYQTYHYPVS